MRSTILIAVYVTITGSSFGCVDKKIKIIAGNLCVRACIFVCVEMYLIKRKTSIQRNRKIFILGFLNEIIFFF